nr:reverse transcriptase domain-containing protein [Tanacetum cinerariifolium]
MEKTQNKPKELLLYGMLLTRLFKHVVSVFPELAIDHYLSHDRVMHPLTPYYERKTRSDHGKKRPHESKASSSCNTLNHPSSSYLLDDTIDVNDEESFHSNSSSPFQNISSSSNVVPRVRQNPPHKSHNLNTYLSETINLQTQQRDAHREGLRPISDEDLREYCDKNYHQILPITAEKLHQEKAQQEKLKEVKARLNFEEASRYSESETPSMKMNLKERLGPRRRMCPHIQEAQSGSHTTVVAGTQKAATKVLALKKHKLLPRSITTKESIHEEQKQCQKILSILESVTLTSQKPRIPSHIKTYDGSEDPDDHLKIFQAAAKTERWAMPTWCHMFNSTLTGNARKKCIKDHVEIHNIKQRDGESTEEFVRRYKLECRDVKGALECMKISRFMHGITNPELIKRLHDKIPKSMDEMMSVTITFLRGEANRRNVKGQKTITFDQGTKAKRWKRPGKDNKKGGNLMERQTAGNINGAAMEKGGKAKNYSNFLSRISNLFPTLGEEDVTKGPMIIEAGMGGHCVHCMYMDGGSSSEILYDNCFSKFFPKIKNQLIPANTPLFGFSGEIIWPLGQISLLVKIGDEKHSTSAWMNFMVVRSPSPYNGIIKRPEVRKIRAIPSMAYEMLKFPMAGGIVTLWSCRIIPLECSMVLEPGVPRPKPADMTGVPQHIADHRLNVYEGCLPVRQKKRGQAPERNKAIGEELENVHGFQGLKQSIPQRWLSATENRLEDDLVIKSRTKKEVIRDIEETFKTLREINMKLNPKKCAFGMREGTFLGYKVDADGLRMCPDKVEAVPNLPSPKCLKDVQKLNGKLASLNKFLSKSAEKSLPFFKTLKKCTKKSDFQWTTEAEMAFKGMKKLIAELPMLMAPKEKEELIMYLAAAKEAIIAVLMTERDGKRARHSVPNKDVSKGTNPGGLHRGTPGGRYTNGGQGGTPRPMNIIHGRIILHRHANSWSPDSRANRSTKSPSKRGLKTRSQPDAFRKITSTSFAHLSKQVLVEELREKSIDEKEILVVVEEEGHTWMTPVYEYLMEGILLEEKKKARVVRRKAKRYAVINEVLDKKSFIGPWLRCVGPLEENYVLKEIHEGSCNMHAGPRSVVAKALRSGPSSRAKEPTGKANSHHISMSILKWGIDMAGPFPEGLDKVKFIIMTMDYITKWIEAKPMATITGAQVKKIVWDNIVCRFGLPGEIVSDNGKQFRDNPFKDRCEKIMILAEIGIPTLRTAKVDMVKNNEALGISLDFLEEKREQAAIQEARSKAKMERYYNARVRSTSFRPGDFVYQNKEASHAEDGGKLGPKWEGPYEFTKALGKGAYKLRDCNGHTLSRT